jgi:hypothetical protein
VFIPAPPVVTPPGGDGAHAGDVPNPTTAPALRRRLPVVHLHRLRHTGDDPFSGATLYACRCGVVRPAP